MDRHQAIAYTALYTCDALHIDVLHMHHAVKTNNYVHSPDGTRKMLNYFRCDKLKTTCILASFC